jgi:hypothetical protein
MRESLALVIASSYLNLKETEIVSILLKMSLVTPPMNLVNPPVL